MVDDETMTTTMMYGILYAYHEGSFGFVIIMQLVLKIFT